MKMRFLRTHRRRNAFFGPGAGAVSLALVGVIVLLFVLRLVFPDALLAMATPVWRAGDSLSRGVGNITLAWTSKAELAEERDRLVRENTTLLENARMLEAERTDLARLLGSRTVSGAGILAGVLARPPVSPYDTLVVDQGADAGVIVGSTVHGNGGTPIGTVESVSSAHARVLLYSAPGHRSEGWVGEERLPITLAGAGAGAFRATVARDAGVTTGDTVYLPGPGAVPVGTVVQIDTDPSAPRATVHIRPFTNPFSVTWVEIEKN